ncbi:MAG TPA: hypothetical protein PK725_16550, partial [Rhodocyclaceae bacterium]|nr:hypothetical protein [Rhodocyclaceae bacterium]
KHIIPRCRVDVIGDCESFAQDVVRPHRVTTILKEDPVLWLLVSRLELDAYDEADLSALAPGSVCPGYHARPFREVCNSIKAI